MSNKVLKYGTHNSGTSSKLVWWQRLFAPFMHLTSRCQSRTISEQISDGVILFNFQICYYQGNWHFSHGLCIYEDKFLDSIHMLKNHLKENIDKKIYFQLSLDKNFLVGQDVERFKKLISLLTDAFCDDRLIMMWGIVEGGETIYSNGGHGLKYEEHYWTLGWAKTSGKWYNFFPLPKYYAKKNNKRYIEECKRDVLMLDFYELV